MYNLIETRITDQDGISRTTYGITFKNTVIKDISTDKSKIEELINLCNNLNLSPIHINDVIDDFLVDLTV